MSGLSIRQQYMRQFKGLGRTSRAGAYAIVAGYLAQLLAAGGLGYWILSGPVNWLGGLALAIIVFFIATRLRGFNNIVHECTHYSFSEDRATDTRLGSFCASMILGCFRDYRDEHLTHHAHLGDYDRDMDLHGIRDLRLEAPLTGPTVLRHILTPLFGLHLPYYLNPDLSAKDGRLFWALKIALIAGALLFLIHDPLRALILVWIPYVWAFTALNYWTDCIDHGGLLESGDELDASRNFVVPRAIRAIVFPRNDCFHLVHHLFPQVPSGHLETCHEKLMSHPAYRERAESGRMAGPIPMREPG